MKLTIEKAISLRTGIAELEGYQRIIKDGGTEKVAGEFYKFAPGFRMAMARNEIVLDDALKPFHKARVAIIREKSGGGNSVEQGTPAGDAVTAAVEPMVQEEIEVDLCEMNESEFALEANQIPSSTLAKLMPLIKTKA